LPENSLPAREARQIEFDRGQPVKPDEPRLALRGQGQLCGDIGLVGVRLAVPLLLLLNPVGHALPLRLQ